MARPDSTLKSSSPNFDGILNVSAKDLGTAKEQKFSMTGMSGLTNEEVEKLRKEAEEHRKARLHRSM
jgi:molecular chaperone DnaK (HSP70)